MRSRAMSGAWSALLSLLAAAAVQAQATATVDPLDRAYEHLELIRGEGILDRPLLTQRPLSRGEVARLAAEARERLRSDPKYRSVAAERAISALEAEFAASDESAPLAAVALEAMYLDSPWRPVGTGDLGGIDALTNPLAEFRQGRAASRGMNAYLRTDHRLQLGRHLAVSARPMLRIAGSPVSDEARTAATLEQLYAVTKIGNLRILLGRDYVVFGPGMRGGLSLTQNAPALDMVRLSTERPVTLPWILRVVGPVRATALLADLGPDQNFPRARLAAARASFAPLNSVEVGATLLQHVGGAGSPPATFGEKLADFFPLIDAIVLGDRDLQFSNKLSGVDARLTLPRQVQLYGELLFDDFDLRRVRSTLWEDASLLVGLAVPRVVPSGALRLDLEAHHTGLRMYQHGQFVSGFTRDRWILGDPLGARANAGYARLTHGFASDRAVALEAAHEWRSDDQYDVVVSGPDDSGWRFVRSEIRPKERRSRLTVDWRERFDGRSTLSVVAGAERVENFSFEAGRDLLNVVVRVGLHRAF